MNPLTDCPTTRDKLRIAVNNTRLFRPNLSEEMEALTGFPIRWSRINIAQAHMVWLAWRAVVGRDEAARYSLDCLRSIAIEEREQIDPEEVARLREIAAQFKELEQIVHAAHNPEWTVQGTKETLFQIIQERNLALMALGRLADQVNRPVGEGV